MPGYYENVYYFPEKLGLELVAEYEAYGYSAYEFAITIVLMDGGGKLFAASDSGCSCYSPFEDHNFPSDFCEVSSWEEVKAILDQEFPRREAPIDDFRTAIKAALA